MSTTDLWQWICIAVLAVIVLVMFLPYRRR